MNTTLNVKGLYNNPITESKVMASQWLPVIVIAGPIVAELSQTIKFEMF